MKWKAPGYHIIIPPSGSPVRLADDEAICNGVAGRNSTCLHVSYIGGVDENGHALDNRTAEQSVALVQVLKAWRKKYPKAKIQGHRDFLTRGKAGWKECPAFDAIREYKGL